MTDFKHCLRQVLLVTVTGCGFALTGCARNPSFSILGSYFPSWAFCIVVASVLTLSLRWVLRRLNWEYQLAPLVLIYPCVALILCLSLWLVLYGVR